jgi:hypothetical protein
MSSLNPLNVGPETEDFVAKAEAFFGGSSYTALQIANRFKNERTSAVKDFAAEIGVPANNADVTLVAEICDKFVGYTNAAGSKRFAKADGSYSVATIE